MKAAAHLFLNPQMIWQWLMGLLLNPICPSLTSLVSLEQLALIATNEVAQAAAFSPYSPADVHLVIPATGREVVSSLVALSSVELDAQ